MVSTIFHQTYYGIDSIIDVLIFLVAALISYQSHRVYRIVRDKQFKYFSWAFLFISLAFFFKVISNFTIFHKVTINGVNFIVFIASELKNLQLLHFIAFTLFKILALTGFLILFLIITKTRKRENVILFFYLTVISILFSLYFNFVFYTTLVILLFYITVHFYDNYERSKTRNSLRVFIAFLLILVGNIFGIFHELSSLFYIFDEFLLLIGFVILLVNHIIIKNDKKKDKIRVVRDILDILKDNKNVKITHLIYKANLSSNSIKLYIAELIKLNLIQEVNEKDKKYFKITKKGHEYLEEYGKIKLFSEAYGLN